MADLIWETTKKGYYAIGADVNYEINRTPGHRFWLCVDGAQVKSGKLTDLKDAAQRNENAGAADAPPAKSAPKVRTHRKPEAAPEPPATTVVPVAAVRREYVGAVDATTPDAYPPRQPAATAESASPASAPDDVQSVIQAAAQIRKTWAAEGATREGIVREFGELLGVIDPFQAPDDDADDSDIDTPLAPNVPDPPHHDHGDPVGVRPQAFRTPQPRQSATGFPRPLVDAFRAALRPAAKIVAGDGRPVRSWLGGVIR